MIRENIARGLVAGAAGTTALDVTTYLDMVLRGRPPSTVPSDTARRLAERAGIDALDGDDQQTQHRRAGVGAVLGYADGLLAGAAYGASRSIVRAPIAVGGVALAALTLFVGEGTAVRVGATDWSRWSTAEWLADLVPRLVYGMVTAAAFAMLER